MREYPDSIYCKGFGRDEHYTNKYVMFIGEIPYCSQCLTALRNHLEELQIETERQLKETSLMLNQYLEAERISD